MRTANAVMAAICGFGAACGVFNLSQSNTSTGGLIWSALVVLNVGLAACSAKDAIHTD